MDHRVRRQRAAWDVEIRLQLRQSMAGTALRVEAQLEAFEGGTLIFEKRWQAMVPRGEAGERADSTKGAS